VEITAAVGTADEGALGGLPPQATISGTSINSSRRLLRRRAGTFISLAPYRIVPLVIGGFAADHQERP
jgi:hypothetical protein